MKLAENNPMTFFDYESVAREANIPPEKLALICELVRKDYPDDENLYELHVLRACLAVRNGRVSFDEILKDAVASKT